MREINMKKLSGSRQRSNRERSVLIVCFLFIPLVLLGLFTIYPVISMLIYSFTDWGGMSRPEHFVGFANYIKIFTSEYYRNTFRTTGYYLVAGIIQQVIALFLATILSKKIKGSGFFKGIIFFPFIMNGVAVTLIFKMFFEIGGGFDYILNLLGLGAHIQKWIADPKIVNSTLSFIYIWKNVGYSFLIYLGSMQSVGQELYEAATLDGANAWHQFKSITFPNIKMIIGLLTTFAVVNSVAVFDIPFILTKGRNGTNTFTTTLVDTAFKYNLYGEASAMAILLLVIVAIVLIFKNILFREED